MQIKAFREIERLFLWFQSNNISNFIENHPNMLELKKTTIKDLDTLFVFQQDEEGNHMAAFTPEDPNNKEAYMKKWTGIVENSSIDMQTIWEDDTLIGSVLHFTIGDETNVSYIIEKSYWGKGIATKALAQFIAQSDKAAFYARTAFDNFGSQKVLEKNGFYKSNEALPGNMLLYQLDFILDNE